MRLFHLLTLVCCSLALIAWTGVTWAEQKALAKAEKQADVKVEDEQKQENVDEEQAPKPPPPVLKKKSLQALPTRKSRRRLAPAPQLVPNEFSRQPTKQQPTTKQQIDKQQVIRRLPARQKPNAPFWSPRQSGLSASAAYRLESLGQHVHLSPTMRWHLNRPGSTIAPTASQPLSPAATVTGQGAEKFYPGVSRLPTQKPFAGLEQPPSALERYWPLLLEGREDPNTGVIIWTLP